MITLDPHEIASGLGARIVRDGPSGHPERGEIDSRLVRSGDLFFGLPGASVDGARFAAAAIEAGAWGVVVGPGAAGTGELPSGAWVFESPDPLASLQSLASAWRRKIGARSLGITGSVGKTSTKDIARSLLGDRAHASRENFNTEIGLPLTMLEAGRETEHLVLEMAMRGAGQIAELARIAEPEAGVITNVGPVHTELLGSVEAIAAAKAELLDGLPDGAVAIVPADSQALAPEIDARFERLRFLRFGQGGDIAAEDMHPGPVGISAEILVTGEAAELAGGASSARFEFPFQGRHNLANALAAVGLGVAIGRSLEDMSRLAGEVALSSYRGERIELANGATLINDCYNANPISMLAALDHLAEAPAARRVAVLGLMAELGADAEEHHRSVGRHARESGVDLLVGVGPESRWYGPDVEVTGPGAAVERLANELGSGDLVMVKGSRSAGLEVVAEALSETLGRTDG